MQKKLKLNSCTVNDGKISVEADKIFEVMLNPSDYKHDRTVDYNEDRTPGQIGSDLKFSGIKPETITFNIVIDGTGAVPAASGASSGDVKTQMESLNTIIYKYDGSKHEPSVVRVLWGRLIFYGRLTEIDVNYTLFSIEGVPLRAKIKLSFSSFLSRKEEALISDKSSPDLTHVVVFKDGDTLPLLCYKVYKNADYVIDIARINGITHFRNINPGTRIIFPPLR